MGRSLLKMINGDNMKLSRLTAMIVGSALGTFAVVWWVRHYRLPTELGAKEPETCAWIRLN